MPIRVEIGPRDVQSQQLILVRRDSSEKETVKLSMASTRINQLLAEIQEDLTKSAQERRDANTYEVEDYDDFKEKVELGFVRAFWCGEEDCESQIKSDTKATVRCLPFNKQLGEEGRCVHCGTKSSSEALFARSY